jgi:rubrerythrin
MKIDFGNINDNHIKAESIFYLYGNCKRTFGVFCDFILEKLKNKFSISMNDVEIFYVSASECVKIVNSQCDLFGTKISFFCVKNVEDGHADKLLQIFGNKNNVFVLESGDYIKSKSVTENFTKNANIYAVASFKNDITMLSLCKMLLPSVPSSVHREIVQIMNETDEDFTSLFKKISLLLNEQDSKLLKEYVTYRRSFLQDLDFIPLTRYLLRLSLKEKLGGKKQDFLKLDLSKKDAIETLIKAEIGQKISTPLPKSVIYSYFSASNANFSANDTKFIMKS